MGTTSRTLLSCGVVNRDRGVGVCAVPRGLLTGFGNGSGACLTRAALRFCAERAGPAAAPPSYGTASYQAGVTALRGHATGLCSRVTQLCRSRLSAASTHAVPDSPAAFPLVIKPARGAVRWAGQAPLPFFHLCATSERVDDDSLHPADLRSAEEFMAALRALKARSGLTLRQLENRAADRGDVLPRSTVADILRKQTLPRPDLVAALVRACGEQDRLAEWTGAWKRLACAVPIADTGPTDTGPAHSRPDRRQHQPRNQHWYLRWPGRRYRHRQRQRQRQRH